MYNIKIIFYDINFIAISKPYGIEINNILRNKIKNNIPNNGILNRLDKYTSGIIIIARNLLFYFFYKKITIFNFIKKKYLAIILGYLNQGFINLSICKKKNIKIKRFSKKSLSYYKKIKNKNNYTLINIVIKTGRTHQIRKHLLYIGFNLKNDFYYNKNKKFLNTLHFKKISFFYPLKMRKFLLFCNLFKEIKKILLTFFSK